MHAYFVFKNIFLRIIIQIKNNSLVIQVVHMNSLYINYYIFFLSSYGNDGLPAVVDDLSCFYSTYLTIFQCSYSTSISSSCTSDNDVSVSCCKFITETYYIAIYKTLNKHLNLMNTIMWLIRVWLGYTHKWQGGEARVAIASTILILQLNNIHIQYYYTMDYTDL